MQAAPAGAGVAELVVVAIIVVLVGPVVRAAVRPGAAGQAR